MIKNMYLMVLLKTEFNNSIGIPLPASKPTLESVKT